MNAVYRRYAFPGNQTQKQKRGLATLKAHQNQLQKPKRGLATLKSHQNHRTAVTATDSGCRTKQRYAFAQALPLFVDIGFEKNRCRTALVIINAKSRILVRGTIDTYIYSITITAVLPTVHTQTIMFAYFHLQHLILITMAPRETDPTLL